MMTWNWDRIAAGTGIGAVALFIVGFILVGDAPKLDDPASKITAYYSDHRGKLVAAAILFGLAGLLFTWFLGALSTALRGAGQARLAATAFGGGVVFLGVLLLIVMATGAIVLVVQEGGDEGAAQALSQLTWAGEVMIAWPAAALAGATAAAVLRSGILPQWYAWAGGLAALVLVLGGTTWARDGFWAPDGAFGMITFVVFLAWTLVTSGLLLMRRVPAAEAPMAASVAT